MLSIPDYLDMDAVGLAEGIRRGDFSSAEATEAAIGVAERVDPKLNALTAALFGRARESARRIDAAGGPGRLAGVPFLIKDLSELKGAPTTYGSRLYLGNASGFDADIVRRYLDAGLVALGKTNTPEFGLTFTTEPAANGATRNPWSLEHSPGGSSGGAAAAVAAGIVPAAHASDGGGSIRVPASCCGLFGLKPSRGLTVVESVLAGCWSGFSVGHVLCRTVRDSAAFLDIVVRDGPDLFPRPDAPDSFLDALDGPLRPLRVGVQTAHPFGLPVDRECVAAVERAARLCEDAGHRAEPVEHPADCRAAVAAMNRIVCVHVHQAVKKRLDELSVPLDEAPVEASTRAMARRGREVSADDYVRARDVLQREARKMDEFHRRCEVVVSPALAMPPARLGWLDMDSGDLEEYDRRFRAYGGFTALHNGTGQPSMSVPLHRTGEGLPVGAMFSAAWGGDLALLRLARALEQAAPWPRLAPLGAQEAAASA